MKKLCISVLSVIVMLSMLLSQTVLGEDINYCGKGEGKEIAITFDDGPHGKYTPLILDILGKYNVPATFFVVGTNADRYPELVKREILEGHEIGSHTYYHRHISKMNGEELRDDLELNEQKLIELTGMRPTLFRPPEGICNDNVKKTAKEMGYSIIMWTVDTNDWQGIEADEIVDCVKKNTVSGSIILFHDFVSKKSGTPQALEVIIPYLLSEGYTFVTVSQLLELSA